ncbi:selT-like protein [Mangifera indica]|uniref:selT-like protein n=1 Tax=Mangifera indica TaxID=29780 RepID=UPI001CFA91A6|nr:selT-like protein [Mangifera indica]
MDRVHFFLLGLPVFLLCSDLLNLFTPPPPPPASHPKPGHHHHHHHKPPLSSDFPEFPKFPEFPAMKAEGGIGHGSTININFCASCSYRGTAITMKKMLENQFPRIDVILENYPPPMPKRLLAKVVPVVQFGVIGIIMAGEQIFPMMGIMTPSWYYSLRANKFGSIASTWLLGNFLQSFLQSSGAFEVYCNDELVFSKLKEGRFPGEIELRDLVTKKLSTSRLVHDLGEAWS